MGTTYQSHRRDEEENKNQNSKSSAKDRKKWCRGKVGVKHKYVYGFLGNVHTYREPGCNFRSGWNKNSGVVKNAYWNCGESEYCEGCGKIKRHYLDKDCTKFTGDKSTTLMSFMEFLHSNNC